MPTHQSSTTDYLKAIGLTRHRRCAACTLGRMVQYGLPSRVKRGLCRINRYHPELMAIGKVERPEAPDAP
ncbi:MAG: hypothetical protein ACTSVG_05555 [Alphaproteobacteria bacterium]